MYVTRQKKTWRFLSYNKVKSILSFYVNLLLKLSLSQSILITIFTFWTQCLWGGVRCCQHIPASGRILTKAWRNFSMFSGLLSEGSLPGRFLFAADCVCLQFLTHNSTVLRLGTLSFWWILKGRRSILWVRTTVLEIRLHSESPMLYRPALHGNWSALSLAGRALKDNSPRQRFHLQLCCQIVRYSCGPCSTDQFGITFTLEGWIFTRFILVN